ncbi:hypothetical protein L485_01070 [Sphingobium baderi LL03]|uniref:DUF6471 domain-containing protein n=1 Tax=Sphingobium baderi LL03 TaxID=1114964 RepID=T0H2D8_9SPHN|nr:hypothetical protein L485_01070 [Sphingobium baderi LL03]
MHKGKCIVYDGVCDEWSANVADTEWEAKVKGLLKAELKRRNVSYAQLVEKLAAVGVVDSEPNIRNKLSRGKFTAVFLVQCLEAIGATSLRLAE